MWYKCLRRVLESQIEKKIWYLICETKKSTSGIKSVTGALRRPAWSCTE